MESLIELSSGSIGSTEVINWWMKDLNLLITDKEILQKRGEWFNDSIINASLDILRKQFPDIRGFQNCLLMTVKCEKSKNWVYDQKHKFHPIESGVQIHHTGKSHWVTSVKLPNENNIHILDSASNTKLTSSLEIQIATLYMKPNNSYNITFSKVQPQLTGECGIHAVANAVEYCLTKLIENVHFDREKMTTHCMQCLEAGEFTPFPKKGRTKGRLTVKPAKSIILTCHCICGLPDFIEDLVQCEKVTCGKWFHFSCTDYNINESSSKAWHCKSCK